MELLINLIREHEVIYDTTSLKYKDQNIRNEAWEEISAAMDMSAGECKETWAKLRNCYANAMKRRRTKKCSQPTSKTAPWRYEKEMAFLLPFMESRLSQKNLVQEDNSISMNDNIETAMTNDSDSEQSWNLGLEPEVLLDTPKKRKAEDDIAREMVNVLKETAKDRRDRYSQNEMAKSNYDEVDMFYLSMAKIVKRLPKIEQAKIRMDFCKIVSEAEIRQMEAENISRPSSSHSVAY